MTNPESVTNLASGGRPRALLGAGLALLGLTAALLVAYRVIGSDVDADGWLHEPFALIPLAWLTGPTGAVLVVIDVWRARRHRR